MTRSPLERQPTSAGAHAARPRARACSCTFRSTHTIRSYESRSDRSRRAAPASRRARERLNRSAVCRSDGGAES
eukprot:2157949-Prymnesium_polylepis.1